MKRQHDKLRGKCAPSTRMYATIHVITTEGTKCSRSPPNPSLNANLNSPKISSCINLSAPPSVPPSVHLKQELSLFKWCFWVVVRKTRKNHRLKCHKTHHLAPQLPRLLPPQNTGVFNTRTAASITTHPSNRGLELCFHVENRTEPSSTGYVILLVDFLLEKSHPGVNVHHCWRSYASIPPVTSITSFVKWPGKMSFFLAII